MGDKLRDTLANSSDIKGTAALITAVAALLTAIVALLKLPPSTLMGIFKVLAYFAALALLGFLAYLTDVNKDKPKKNGSDNPGFFSIVFGLFAIGLVFYGVWVLIVMFFYPDVEGVTIGRVFADIIEFLAKILERIFG